MPSIAAVILNWNGAADTVACLESIGHQRSRDVQILVIDNGSEDDSRDRIRGWASDHKLAIVRDMDVATRLKFARDTLEALVRISQEAKAA